MVIVIVPVTSSTGSRRLAKDKDVDNIDIDIGRNGIAFIVLIVFHQ
jgi:hypothetical protein